MTFASRPMRESELASEEDRMANLSVPLNRQFISGSEERPVSKAKTCFVISPKHSSMESKPDLLPKIPKYGVHAWAGTKSASGAASRRYPGTKQTGRPPPPRLRNGQPPPPHRGEENFVFPPPSMGGVRGRMNVIYKTLAPLPRATPAGQQTTAGG